VEVFGEITRAKFGFTENCVVIYSYFFCESAQGRAWGYRAKKYTF
jgi:hypothetical protein